MNLLRSLKNTCVNIAEFIQHSRMYPHKNPHPCLLCCQVGQHAVGTYGFQTVNLGVLADACITRPDTCGPHGATVMAWIKLINCPHNASVLSSTGQEWTTGFKVVCFNHGVW